MTVQQLQVERRSSLDETLEHGGLFVVARAGVADPAPPVFWGEDIEPRLLTPHRNSAPHPLMGLVCIRDALLRGDVHLTDDLGRLYFSAMLFPSYLNGWIQKNEVPKQQRALDELECVEVQGTSVLAHNCNAGVYGHWLVEGLPTLLLVRSLALESRRFVVQKGAPPHVAKWIEHVVPDAEIVTYDPATQYLRCEVLLTPTLACSQHYVFNPALNQLLDQIAPKRRAERLLYLDRPWRGVLHWMTNAEEVQALAQSFGFEVFSPIERTVQEQIDAFASARVIAGDYGSSLHNALFSPPEARVLCFNWVTFIQSRIAQARKQRIGFQMGDTGAPLTGAGYTVNPDAARRAFDAALKSGD